MKKEIPSTKNTIGCATEPKQPLIPNLSPQDLKKCLCGKRQWYCDNTCIEEDKR